MKVSWEPLGNEVDHEMVWGSIGLAILLAVRFLPTSCFSAFLCPFRVITGCPCPFCGATRSFIEMGHLHVRAAFSLNPIGALLFLAAIPLLLYAIVSVLLQTPRLRIRLTRRWEGRLLRGGVMLIIVFQWGYQVWCLRE